MKSIIQRNFIKNVAVLTAAAPFIILSLVWSNPPGNQVAMDNNSTRMADVSEPVLGSQKIYYVAIILNSQSQ